MPHHLLFREMLRLSLRNFRVKPVRAVLTVLGMSIGFGVVLFLVSLGYGLQFILIGNLVATEDSLVTLQAAYPSETNLYFAPNKIAELQQIPSVSEVTPVAQFSAEVAQVGGENPALVSVYIADPSYFRLMGVKPDIGNAYSAGVSEAVVTSQTLALLGMASSSASIQKPITLTVYYEDSLHATTTTVRSAQNISIVGIITDDAQAPTVYIPTTALTQSPPFFQMALVKAKTIDTVETVRTELVNKGFIVSARIDLVKQARQITNIITIVLAVFGVTALIVSAIGMFNTMIVSFMERTYEVGILKSLGATDTDVRNLFLVESATMGAMGGTSGVVLGVLVSQGINLGLNILSTNLGGKSFTLFITPFWFMGLTIGLSILIGLVSGFWPAHRASKLSPKEAFLHK